MKIETIRLKNFKVYKDLELKDLPSLAIFVGANGTGKSTIFEVFEFLGQALSGNVKSALASKGGFKEVVSRGQSGPIEIELQYRLNILNKERLVTYVLHISEEKGQPVVEREILRYKRQAYGSPFHFLDFKRGEGYAITNEEDYSKSDEELEKEYQKLGSPDILAIKGLGQFDRFKAASAFRDFIEKWHVSDFHISEARPTQEAGHANHLSSKGENLALVAQYIYEQYPDVFKKVLKKMSERVPGIEQVEAKLTEDGRVVLRFRDGAFKDPFIARFVSDGTIKMFAYLLLLHDPNPHPLLCVEEPENQLYPELLREILEEFRLYAKKGGQVFITTHSPDLLNAAQGDEVYWLTKQHGITQVHRVSEYEHVNALLREGATMGFIWTSGYLKGL